MRILSESTDSFGIPTSNPEQTLVEAARVFSIPRTTEIEELESVWVGGISDFGNKEAARVIQYAPGYSEYKKAIEISLRENFGERFKVYRAMPLAQLEQWKKLKPRTSDFAFTLKRDVADQWKKLAFHKSVDLVVISMEITPDSVLMLGSEAESEVVISGIRLSIPNIKIEPTQESFDPEQTLVEDLDQWDSGVWIHYSEFPELKINPKQFHQDPVGIYLFPEGFKTMGRWERMKYKFRVKLKRSLSILDISKLSLEQCLDILRKLIPADQWSESTVLEAQDFRDAFWEVMKNYFVLSQSGPFSKAAWNKALREIGYDAVFDDTASIHSAEVQLLVLDPSAVQVVERIDQKATGFSEIDDLAGRLGKMLEPYGEVTIERPKSKKDWYSGKRELSASVSVKNGDRELGFSIYPRFYDKDSTPESITVHLKSGAREFRSIMSRAESFQWKDRPWADLSKLEKLVKQAAAEEFAVKEDQELFTDPTGKFWGNAGAGGLFYAEDTGRYLISKRSQAVNEPNTWGTWGGKLDADETPEEALAREIKEETGYRGPYRLEWLYAYKSGNFQFDNYLIIVPHEFEPKHSWETSDHAWVEFGEWPEPLHFGMKSLIPHLKKLGESMFTESVDFFGIPLVEDFKTSAKRFQDQGASEEEVTEYFIDFKALKPRITDAAKRDIDKWKNWDEFKAFIDELKATKSKRQDKKAVKSEGADLVAENDKWLVYHITSHNACMSYGANTKWCITSQDPFRWNDYASKGNFYFLISKEERDDSFNKVAIWATVDGRVYAYDEEDTQFNPAKVEEKLGWPGISEFIEIPEEGFLIVDGKQVKASEALEEFKKEPALLKEKVKEIFGKKVADEKYEIRGTDLVLFGGLYFEDFVNKLTLIFGTRDLEHLDLSEPPEFYDWTWSDSGHEIDRLIDSLPEKDTEKLKDALLASAKEAGIIEQDDDRLRDRDYEELFKGGHAPEEISDAVSMAISDGYSVGSDQERFKAFKRALTSADVGLDGSINEARSKFELVFPISQLLSHDEEDISIDIEDDISWDYGYDHKAADETFKDQIQSFLKSAK